MNARPATRLALLCGVIYFVQGIGEPTEGLIAQPTRWLLRGWGLGADEIAGFMLIVGLPWYLKPLLGLLTDQLPILGSPRHSYLLPAALMPGSGLMLAGLLELTPGVAAVQDRADNRTMSSKLKIPRNFESVSSDERIEFVLELWDLIAQSPKDVRVPDEHKGVLDERLDTYAVRGQPGRPWPEVRDELLSNLRR